MWKFITVVVAVVCLALAAFLFRDGHQASDDASAARAQARSLTEQAKTTRDQAAKKVAAGAALGRRRDSTRTATTNLREQTSRINSSIGNVLTSRGVIIDAINPVISQRPSTQLREQLDSLLRGLANDTTATARDYERLRAASDAINKAVR
jgi:hypothetical protein